MKEYLDYVVFVVHNQSLKMALLNETDRKKNDNLYLVMSYKPRRNILSTKYVSNLSSVDLKSNYVHFRTKELTPIVITKVTGSGDDLYRELFSYFVMEREKFQNIIKTKPQPHSNPAKPYTPGTKAASRRTCDVQSL